LFWVESGSILYGFNPSGPVRLSKVGRLPYPRSMLNGMSELVVRDAAASDAAAIVALVQSTYRGESSRRGWTTEADFLDGQRIDAAAVLEILERPQSRIRLFFQAGELLACAQVMGEAGDGYFGLFSVRADCQGRGIGKQVLADAEKLVRDQWRCARICMTVIDVRDELIAFYERRGYRRTGIKKPFPYGDPRYGLPRRDDLRFELLEKWL